MKQLNWIFICGLFALPTSPVLSQTIVVQSGYTAARMSVTLDGTVMDGVLYRTLHTAHVGALAEFTLPRPWLAVGMGGMLQPKGCIVDQDFVTEDGISLEFKNYTEMWYAEVPVSLIFQKPLRTSRIFVSAGGYLGAGLGGRWGDSRWPLDGNNSPVRFSSKESIGYKRWDYGASLGCGIDLSRTRISCTYSRGFANLAHNTGDLIEWRVHNRYLNCSIGRTIALKSKKDPIPPL